MSQRKIPPGRGSSSARRPIHSGIFSASTMNAKIVSGAASMRISRSTALAVAGIPSPLLVFGCVLEALESIAPELIQERLHFGEHLGPRAVEPSRALAAFDEQPGLLQHGEVL